MYDKVFGEEPFELGVTINTEEAELQYTVTMGTDVAAVAADGTVTLLKAGQAKIQLYVPESTNYNEAQGPEFLITVAKKEAITLPEQSRSYFYNSVTEESIAIWELLPSDCGKIESFTCSENSFQSDVALDKESGLLTYKAARNSVGAEEAFELEIITENYVSIAVKIVMKWTAEQPVFVKQGTEISLVQSVLVYGETLSGMQFAPASIVDTDGNPVAGTLAWEAGTAVPKAGTESARWKFTPDKESYQSLTGTVAITVKKAEPSITALPVAEGTVVYAPGLTLADISLTGGSTVWTVNGQQVSVGGTWSWKEPSAAPAVGTDRYAVTFTPDDMDNYESTLAGWLTLTVEKAVPYVETAPAAAAITYGDTLGSAALTGGSVRYGDGRGNASALQEGSSPVSGSFSWKQTDIKTAVADSESTGYTVVFTPTESDFYQTVELKVTLRVNKASNPPAMPEGIMNVSNDCRKVAQAVLPEGWVWQETDLDKELAAGAETTATAVYVGTDKDNYEKLEVTVRLFRAECEHPGTTVKNVRSASCTEPGYTGDTYCTACGILLTTGRQTEALGHSYNSLVTKQPTTEEEGIRTYTCTACGSSYTETIPKLDAEDDDDTEDEDTGNNDNAGNNGTPGNNGNAGNNGAAGNNDGAGNNGNAGNNGSAGNNGAAGNNDGAGNNGNAGNSGVPGNQEGTGSDDNAGNNDNAGNSGTAGNNEKAPFIKGENGREGWEVICEKA